MEKQKKSLWESVKEFAETVWYGLPLALMIFGSLLFGTIEW